MTFTPTQTVVNGAIVLSSDLADSEEVPSFDASIVTTPDILANNGVVHLIDTVLMPSAEEATQEEDDSSASFVTLYAMIQSAVVLAAALML